MKSLDHTSNELIRLSPAISLDFPPKIPLFDKSTELAIQNIVSFHFWSLRYHLFWNNSLRTIMKQRLNFGIVPLTIEANKK